MNYREQISGLLNQEYYQNPKSLRLKFDSAYQQDNFVKHRVMSIKLPKEKQLSKEERTIVKAKSVIEMTNYFKQLFEEKKKIDERLDLKSLNYQDFNQHSVFVHLDILEIDQKTRVKQKSEIELQQKLEQEDGIKVLQELGYSKLNQIKIDDIINSQSMPASPRFKRTNQSPPKSKRELLQLKSAASKKSILLKDTDKLTSPLRPINLQQK